MARELSTVLPGVVRQNGYVVEDLDTEVDRWWRLLGIGPWFVLRDLEVPDARYRDQVVTVEMSLALANSGDLQVELIQPHGDGPSCWREFLDAGHRGLHHLAWWTEDVDAVMARATEEGWGVLQSGDLAGTRFCYFDIGVTPGTVAEVMALNDMSRWLATTVRDAAADWDGRTDPVRTLG